MHSENIHSVQKLEHRILELQSDISTFMQSWNKKIGLLDFPRFDSLREKRGSGSSLQISSKFLHLFLCNIVQSFWIRVFSKVELGQARFYKAHWEYLLSLECTKDLFQSSTFTSPFCKSVLLNIPEAISMLVHSLIWPLSCHDKRQPEQRLRSPGQEYRHWISRRLLKTSDKGPILMSLLPGPFPLHHLALVIHTHTPDLALLKPGSLELWEFESWLCLLLAVEKSSYHFTFLYLGFPINRAFTSLEVRINKTLRTVSGLRSESN